MPNAKLVQRGCETGANLNHIIRDAKKLIKCNSWLIVEMIFTIGQAHKIVDFKDAVIILCNQNRVIIVSDLLFPRLH